MSQSTSTPRLASEKYRLMLSRPWLPNRHVVRAQKQVLSKGLEKPLLVGDLALVYFTLLAEGVREYFYVSTVRIAFPAAMPGRSTRH